MARKKTPRIMVVDDELSMREFLEIALMKEGYTVEVASDPRGVLSRLEKVRFELILSDIRMPFMSGMELLREVKRIDPSIPVIMITAHADTDQAVEAMKLGADDYIPKPFKLDELKIKVATSLERRKIREENRELKREIEQHYPVSNLVGQSPPMVRLMEMIDRVAPAKTNILITGESGTGKELVARAVHLRSDRATRTFLPVNCGAIPRDLMEAEFFGHMRGSFTGAVANKPGFFEAAHQGTLFLDEIGDLPLDLQVKLLRVIQEGEVTRLGSTEPIGVDVRILAATNRNLEKMVAAGTFREDLYYRLNVISLQVPALRERVQDIPLLLDHFISKISRKLGRTITGAAPDFIEALQRYGFPGNVREMENLVERTIALSSNERLELQDLPPLAGSPGLAATGGGAVDLTLPLVGRTLDDVVAAYEKSIVARAIEQAEGSRKEAAALLGINERAVRYLVDKYQIG